MTSNYLNIDKHESLFPDEGFTRTDVPFYIGQPVQILKFFKLGEIFYFSFLPTTFVAISLHNGSTNPSKNCAVRSIVHSYFGFFGRGTSFSCQLQLESDANPRFLLVFPFKFLKISTELERLTSELSQKPSNLSKSGEVNCLSYIMSSFGGLHGIVI